MYEMNWQKMLDALAWFWGYGTVLLFIAFMLFLAVSKC